MKPTMEKKRSQDKLNEQPSQPVTQLQWMYLVPTKKSAVQSYSHNETSKIKLTQMNRFMLNNKKVLL